MADKEQIEIATHLLLSLKMSDVFNKLEEFKASVTQLQALIDHETNKKEQTIH